MPNPLFLGLSGGGVNGVAQVGSMMALQEAGFLNRDELFVVGTSAGALNGLTLVLGFNAEDYRKLVEEFDANNFFYTGNKLETVVRFWWRLGAYSGRNIREFINKIIKQKTGLDDPTFEQLYAHDQTRHLFVIASNISRRGIIGIFSHLHTPEVKVAYGIQASMAVPWLYKPVRFKKNSEGHLVRDDVNGDYYVDGGVVDNFILHFFDSKRYLKLDENILQLICKYGYNPRMVGIFLAVNEHEIRWIRENTEPPSKRIKSIFQYSYRIADLALLRRKTEVLRNPDDIGRIIFVDTHGNPPLSIRMRMGKETRDLLVESGKAAAKEYLEQHRHHSVMDPVETPYLRARL